MNSMLLAPLGNYYEIIVKVTTSTGGMFPHNLSIVSMTLAPDDEDEGDDDVRQLNDLPSV